MQQRMQKSVICQIRILLNTYYLNAHYSAILYRYPTKFGIQEEQLLLYVNSKFS